MLEYDIHIHTNSSPCSDQTPEQVVNKARSVGLDGVAITNHNEISGVERARQESDDIDVISGTEITTQSGDILALFVDEYPDGSKATSIVRDIHQRDGIAILAHPCDPLRNGYNHENLDLLRLVDAIEILNSRCISESFNRMAQKLAESNDITMTAGSDAHFPFEIGRGTIKVPTRRDIPHNISNMKGRGMYIGGHIATKIHGISKITELLNH